VVSHDIDNRILISTKQITKQTEYNIDQTKYVYKETSNAVDITCRISPDSLFP